MSSIDWKTKLTSRKFWAAVVGFVVPLLVAFWCIRQPGCRGRLYHHGRRITHRLCDGEGLV